MSAGAAEPIKTDRLKPFVAIAAEGRALSRTEADAAFDAIMAGEATDAQIAGFLMALRMRGETVDEIVAAASAMRARMTRVRAPENAIDIVGTGGDGRGTLNVSTAAAIVVAGAGQTVAKHGNRKLSSLSGAGDVLAALGVTVEVGPETAERALAECGLCFMIAPRHHAAMRHVGPARTQMGVRTIFNLLGPLTNPAGVRRQLTGAFSEAWLEPMARALGELGTERAWLVHGSDGADELAISGESAVVALEDGRITRFTLTPEEAGLPRHDASAIKGGAPEENAAQLRLLLAGKPSAYRDSVRLNAGAALVVAGRAATVREGADLAARSIDTGAAARVLETLARVTAAG